MKLYSKIVGSGKPLLVLHGLFGSGDNWITFANTYAAKGYEVHLIDLRNHGRSPHDPLFDYESMAADIREYIADKGIEKPVIIGHSMGGKALLRFSADFPSSAACGIVVDISPGYFPLRHQQVIDALYAVDFEICKTRKSVEATLRGKLDDEGTCQLLLKGLYWIADDRLAWRFDVDSIGRSIHNIGAEVSTDGLSLTPFLFVRGSESDYVTDRDLVELSSRYPLLKSITIEGAGHRVHADRPLEFVAAVSEFLSHMSQ